MLLPPFFSGKMTGEGRGPPANPCSKSAVKTPKRISPGGLAHICESASRQVDLCLRSKGSPSQGGHLNCAPRCAVHFGGGDPGGNGLAVARERRPS